MNDLFPFFYLFWCPLSELATLHADFKIVFTIFLTIKLKIRNIFGWFPKFKKFLPSHFPFFKLTRNLCTALRRIQRMSRKFSLTHFSALRHLRVCEVDTFLTFPIHESDRIVQSHFVFEFFSKCKCIVDPLGWHFWRDSFIYFLNYF